MPSSRHKHPNELTVVAVFFAVIIIGSVYAILNITLAPDAATSQNKAPAVKPPTLAEYRGEAKVAFGPFLEQAAVFRADQFGAADQVFIDLIDKTQERLLRIRVPAGAREAHLSFVMLLDQWRRAFRGSGADRSLVSDSTSRVIAANPWLMTR